MTKTFATAVLLLASLAFGCTRAPKVESKEAVQEALRQYWKTRQDLALDKMDIEVSQVKFSEGAAEAEVSFRAKGSSGPPMKMRYTLRRSAEGWKVDKGASSGVATPPATGGAGELPSGHPSVGGTPAPAHPTPAPER